MSSRLYIYILILFMVCSIGCGGKKVLDKPGFEKWMKNNKNGLVKEKIINRLKYKVCFQPIDWLMLKSDKQLVMNDQVSKIKKDYESVLTFTIDITDTSESYSMLRYELGHENEYYDRINYYSNIIQNDLYLVDGTDTLPCMFTHMEQTYNVSPINTITVEFVRKDKTKKYNDTWLVYNDRVFNSGILKFFFKKEDLNNIPELKI